MASPFGCKTVNNGDMPETQNAHSGDVRFTYFAPQLVMLSEFVDLRLRICRFYSRTFTANVTLAHIKHAHDS